MHLKEKDQKESVYAKQRNSSCTKKIKITTVIYWTMSVLYFYKERFFAKKNGFKELSLSISCIIKESICVNMNIFL